MTVDRFAPGEDELLGRLDSLNGEAYVQRAQLRNRFDWALQPGAPVAGVKVERINLR